MSTPGAGHTRDLNAYVAQSVSLEPLARLIVSVLERLPREVVSDLLGDPRFRLALDDFTPGQGRTVWMACPTSGASGSRSVVLKPRLAERPVGFARYVIAHELAHAFLRNGGWNEITDPEEAADALAASWGFPRPA